MAERELAAVLGRRHCVTTCNGSAAIVIALQALGIGAGDRVLLPATTWVGCATAVLRVGACPVFADAAVDSPLVSLGSPVPNISAILAVHVYASRLDVRRLRAIYAGVPVVEDISHCATAVNSEGLPLGGLGDIAILSLQASKVLTCGEGGAALTDDSTLALRLEALRTDSRLSDYPGHGVIPLRPGSIHGANYALSELSAALLLDQLERLPEQKRRRANGAMIFLDALGDSVRAIGDREMIAGGAFYGIPLLAPRLAEKLASSEGDPLTASLAALQVHSLYPPLPEDPLYQPASVNAYRPIAQPRVDMPRSRDWWRRCVVFPHEVFLAEPTRLVQLAECITRLEGGEPVSLPAAFTAESPEVTVVILTRPGSDRPLRRAVLSVAAQDYAGPLSVLVVGDGSEVDSTALTDVMRTAGLRIHTAFFSADTVRTQAAIKRVAWLRNCALSLVDSPLVCFLDDDNTWAPDHVSHLAGTMVTARVPAVHSWRQLVDSNSKPWIPDHFPWLSRGVEERRRFSIYLSAGVFAPGSAVVRDRVELPVDGEDYGMVDLGEWLFATSLLRLLGFETIYSEEEVAAHVGEDDKLLRALQRHRIATACSEQPTLIYRLGGFSNHSSER